MFSNLRISARIGLGFSLVLLLLLLLGGVSWRSAQQSNESLSDYADQGLIVDQVQRADVSVLRARMGFVRYIINGKSENTTVIATELAAAHEELNALRKLMSGAAADQQRINAAADQLRAYESTVKEYIENRTEQDRLNKAIVYDTGSALRALLIEMRDAEIQADHLATLAAVDRVSEAVWTSRILVFRLLDGDKEYDFARVLLRIGQAGEAMTELATLPLANGQIDRVKQAKTMLVSFTSGIKEMVKRMEVLEDIQNNRLTAIAAKVNAQFKEIRDLASESQVRLREDAVATAGFAESTAKILTRRPPCSRSCWPGRSAAAWPVRWWR